MVKIADVRDIQISISGLYHAEGSRRKWYIITKDGQSVIYPLSKVSWKRWPQVSTALEARLKAAELTLQQKRILLEMFEQVLSHINTKTWQLSVLIGIAISSWLAYRRGNVTHEQKEA